ncbi:basement membrane-specific heparan sulfate proteoglycan core protein-like [Egretta garzetta]|uniref:basement membrane-specific heparan sulfate proteoglycan core protein-like n=1 Tax=Egretta garzetta TaxID=188379 RepID=UPI00163C9033|nr:basement membrane-specific heparan sulfate proteoglycan core protein-like [Egretta garzetta]
MSCGLLGTLLLLLPGGASAVGGWFQENPGELWVSPGKTVELSCCVPDSSRSVNWYKEKPDGSLYWIYWSSGSSRPVGKYTGGMKAGRKAEQCFSLIISPAQREDSGVYYCSSRNFYHLFGKGTRLVVTDATEPQLSILVPTDAQEPGQPPAQIPLLCHLHDLPPGWDTVHWQPGGEEAPVVAAAVDEHGVLSAWSITWVSAEQWDGAAGCTALQSADHPALQTASGQR